MRFAIMPYCCSPIGFFFIAVYSSILTWSTRLLPAIRSVLRPSGRTKVFATIVECVTVFVVNVNVWVSDAQNETMHLCRCVITGIKRLRVFIPASIPFVLINEFKVLIIYKGYLALTECDFFHRITGLVRINIRNISDIQ